MARQRKLVLVARDLPRLGFLIEIQATSDEAEASPTFNHPAGVRSSSGAATKPFLETSEKSARWIVEHCCGRGRPRSASCETLLAITPA